MSSLGLPESGKPMVLKFLNTEGHSSNKNEGKRSEYSQNEYTRKAQISDALKYAQLRLIFEAVAF